MLNERCMIDRLKRDKHAPSVAVLARHRERLKQPGPDPFPGHLHQAERCDLGHLMLGPVAGQAFEQPPQHEVTVALQHHVNEVDHDDAADVPDAQLPDNLFGGLQVVTSDRLLQVAALAGEFTGVDVNDGHRLGRVDDQRAAARQPHLALERLRDLLVDAVGGEDVVVVGPALQPVRQVRGHIADVLIHDVPLAVTRDDQLGEVLVKDVPDYPDCQVRLAVQKLRRGRRLGLALDGLPLRGQPLDVPGEFLLGRALRGGPHDDAGVLRHDLLEDLLEPGPLGIGQLAADAGHRGAWHVDEIPAGQAHLAGQPGTLVADRVLGRLHEDRLA